MPLPTSFTHAVRQCAEKFPPRHDPRRAPAAYGTSGFRMVGNLLPPIAARVAFVAVLRVWWAIGNNNNNNNNNMGAAGAAVGCMITASHNPAEDNGMKLIDIDGGMLTTSWEGVCTAAANAITGDELLKVLNEWMERNKINIPTEEQLGNYCFFGAVHLARDTRPTGLEILDAIKYSLEAVKIVFNDHGIIATPQLHYMVERSNRSSTRKEISKVSDFTLSLYNKDIISSLSELLHSVVPMQEKRKRQKIVIDASNGVGTLALQSLFHDAESMTPNPLKEFFDIIILNDDVKHAEALNHMCGADFTQKTRLPSEEMRKWAATHDRKQGTKDDEGEEEEVHYYSLDGDADRVVAFFHNHETNASNNSWELLDGDRISILYALALRHWLGHETLELLDVGVVQTAYANGASTHYIQHHLGLKVYSAATGVKNLHPIAHKRDVGVYFEANGHGTVLFNRPAINEKLLASRTNNSLANIVLSTLPLLLSQVCGDAVADALACEVALLALNMNFNKWHRLYTDLPSLQTKVTVKNPKIITNTSDERRALTPVGLQEAIDAAINTATSSNSLNSTVAARAFVRPSGTEPIVRVYAEASDAAVCKTLSGQVEDLVKHFCDS